MAPGQELEGRKPPMWSLTHVWPTGGCHLFRVRPKGQGWDHIGLVESMHVHCLGDALGPHSSQSSCYIARDTLDCWAAGPTPQVVAAFLQWWTTNSSPGNVSWWAGTQDLCRSVSWVALGNLRA